MKKLITAYIKINFFPVILIPSSKSELVWCHFPSNWGTFFNNFLSVGLLVMNLLVLIYLKMTLFFLYFWIWNSGLTFFSFRTLKIPSSSDLRCFLRGVSSHSYCFLLFVICAFLCCFQDFLYVFGCQKID